MLTLISLKNIVSAHLVSLSRFLVAKSMSERKTGSNILAKRRYLCFLCALWLVELNLMPRRMQVGCLFKLQRHVPLLFRGDSGLLLISMRFLQNSSVYCSMLTGKLSTTADRHLDFNDTSQHFKVCSIARFHAEQRQTRKRCTVFPWECLRTRRRVIRGSWPSRRRNRSHSTSRIVYIYSYSHLWCALGSVQVSVGKQRYTSRSRIGRRERTS